MLISRGQPVLIVLVALAGFLSACQPPIQLATSSVPGISVGITATTCPSVIVQVRQQVTWTNQDNQEHVVLGQPSERDGEFHSGTLQAGDSFAYTFPQPGNHTYACTADAAQMATVTAKQ